MQIPKTPRDRSSPMSSRLPLPWIKDECSIRYKETSYRKSIHLLYRASESIEDPNIRQQLEDIAAMLSGPDSLLYVKEDALRSQGL